MVKAQHKKIQLHYFPDIAPGISKVGSECTAEKNAFKRIHFDDGGPDCSGTAETNTENDPARPSSATDEIEKQAYESGFQEGRESAFESQTVQVESAVKSLNQAATDILNLRQEIYRTVEHEVVELALSIARKVVCQEIKINPDVVVCVAREALSQVDAPGKIKIRLNPADLEFINATQGQISELVHQMDNVALETEESIARGGCVIETNQGDIDARIEKQFQVVEDKFRAEFNRSQQQNHLDENP
jgi:flagellar assembly protein FliH